MTPRILSCAATNVGRVRTKNEDYYFASDLAGLYVLADGMGGHPQGEVASKLAVEAVVEFISPRLDRIADTALEDLLQAAVQAAHARIHDANRGRNTMKAMGTTLCVLLALGEHFAVANVGDTKCYWVSSVHGKHDLSQISHDDSLAAPLIRQGLPPDRVRRGSGGLTQAIGINARVQPHVVCGILHAGDVLLMCSDGVPDYIPLPKFRNLILSLSTNPVDMVKFLIQAALDGGGGDNCTCICVRVMY